MTDSPDNRLEISDKDSKPASTSTPLTSDEVTPWKWHHQSFQKVLGNDPDLQLLHESSYPFAHEAGVFFESSDDLFVTSNRLQSSDGERVQISRISFNRTFATAVTTIQEEIQCDLIHMGNGGVNYRDGILFCAQGSRTSPSGLYLMSRVAPYKTTPILTDYHGVPFNSVNDVVVSKLDGGIWFTDPSYGAEQGYKDAPQLPSQVYCYYPPRGDGEHHTIRAVADGFGHPNGLCFSPDESLLYVTDTDKVHGSGHVFPGRPSSIYSFDIILREEGQPFVCNRRLFAHVEAGIPDGIKCDVTGRVYSGCGDGVHVWSPGGVLLGRILIPGGVANFCFGRPGELFALNECRLWRVMLASNISGSLLANLVNNNKEEKHVGLIGRMVREMSKRLRKMLF